MNAIATILTTDLTALIAAQGRDGGLIGPSVYDTAQLLRFAPPADPHPALAWVAAQQKSDGGWGDPAVPNGRDAATLAAIMALRPHAQNARDHAALEAATHFLRRQAELWSAPGEDIPLAAELLLPWLVADAQASGLNCDPAAYEALARLGARRRAMISCLSAAPATPPTHSWEAWGKHADTSVIDPSGGVGHSPAATAAWLHIVRDVPGLDEARAAARAYLQGAARATGTGIEGVVPTVWPYGRNEQLVSLYTLLLAGLLDEPALQDSLDAQILYLRRAARPDGYGISDVFRADGDLTAMAFAVLAHFGDRPATATLRDYLVDETVGQSCLTYPRELQRSRSATAHAAHALALLDEDATLLAQYLLDRRDQDGRMTREKWHASWLYLTSHANHTLIACNMSSAAAESLDSLLAYQHSDGGWGIAESTAEETAYGVLGLLPLAQHALLNDVGRAALHRAGQWLLANYRPFAEDTTARWAAKEPYGPRRITRIEQVAATLAYVRNGWGAGHD
jgi:hypothetical protein